METLNIEAELQMFTSRACLTYLNAKKTDKCPNVQQVVDLYRIGVYLSTKSAKAGIDADGVALSLLKGLEDSKVLVLKHLRDS